MPLKLENEKHTKDTGVKNPTQLADPAVMIYGDWLFLGDSSSASNSAFLKANEITHIFSIGHKPNQQFEGITYKFIDIKDEDGVDIVKSLDNENICDQIEKVRDEYCKSKKDKKVKKQKALIHCRLGISRSPTAVIYYLFKKENHNMEEAFARVIRERRFVHPRPNFIAQLKNAETNNNPSESKLKFTRLSVYAPNNLAKFADVKLPK